MKPSTKLPKKLDWDLAQDRWATLLNPLISNPISQSQILKNISLVAGNNVINHKLGRKQQGYIITNLTSASTIYNAAEFNNLTLTLNSSAPTAIDLLVF